MTPEWTLHVAVPGESDRQIVARDGLVIGRYPDCDIVLDDRHVSARHARISWDGARFRIADIGSSNGTGVGEDLVLHEGDEHALTDGLILLIGQVEIRVEGPEDADETVGSDGDVTKASHADFDPDMTVPAEDEVGDRTMAAPPDAQAPQPPPQQIVAPPPAPVAPSAPVAPPAAVAPPAPAPPPAFVEPPAAPPVQASPPAQHRPEPSHARVPAQAPGEAYYDPLDSDPQLTLVGAGDDSYTAGAKLTRMGGQLIILNEADLRTVDLSDVEFTIGRSSRAACTLDNRGVSSEHARITFNGTSNVFFVEDLGSANGTYVDDAPVISGSPRGLRSDMHLRFGTIEAVFVQSVDSNFQPVPTERHEAAAKLLVREGQLSTAVVKAARKRAGELGATLGEVLLKEQHVPPRAWTRAVDDARVASTMHKLSGGSQRQLMWVVLVVALGAALYLTFGR